MARRPARGEQLEFRANLVVRWVVLVALFLWTAGGVLAVSAGLPGSALMTVAFFVLFFLIFVTYYWSMAYVVDEYGVTYRGATEFEHFGWEEIVQLKTSDLPLGGYYITTKSGSGFVLSRFVNGHRELAELIAARAGLLPV